MVSAVRLHWPAAPRSMMNRYRPGEPPSAPSVSRRHLGPGLQCGRFPSPAGAAVECAKRCETTSGRKGGREWRSVRGGGRSSSRGRRHDPGLDRRRVRVHRRRTAAAAPVPSARRGTAGDVRTPRSLRRRKVVHEGRDTARAQWQAGHARGSRKSGEPPDREIPTVSHWRAGALTPPEAVATA